MHHIVQQPKILNQQSRYWLLSGLLLCLWMPSTASAQLAKPFEPKVSHQDTYAESMTSVSDFEDGTYLLVQFFTTNVGMGSEKAACKVLHLKKRPGALLRRK